jgi:MFS family permease
VLIASIAGRLVDRHGARGVTGAGIALVVAGFVVFALWPTLAGLIVGLLLLDVGVQSAMIGNQSVIYALQPEARGRLNTVFMTGMFIGGAIGSGAAGFGWTVAGWPAVCAVGAALALGSLAAHLVPLRR